MSIQFVKGEPAFDNLLKHNNFLVANFTASWCGPCQAVKPVVDGLYSDPKYSSIEIVRVDLDANQALARRFQITSVPTFLFFRNGKEDNRVSGFSTQIITLLDKYAESAKSEGVGARGPAKTQSSWEKQTLELVPKGFSILNDLIHYGEATSLNVLLLHKHDEADAKDVFRLSESKSEIFTDADSQGLFFVPLNNICKVHSLLIKKADVQGDGLRLDSDELADECQVPSLVKVWANRPGVLSFDDAADDESATHAEKIDSFDLDWYEIKLKYVRFQKVQNLNIFIDGADEDSHTLVEKILVVGVAGDSTDHGSLANDHDHDH